MSTAPSNTSEKFDMESTLRVLEKLGQGEVLAPEDVKAIKAAAQAILFIHMHGKLRDFQDYLLDIEKAAERLGRVAHSFANMTEAINWLQAEPDPRFGTRVEVAGSPYVVVRQRREMWFLIPAPPIPSFEELTGGS
jgi:hypothetical protein